MSCGNLGNFPASERVVLGSLLDVPDLRAEVEKKKPAYQGVIQTYATADGPRLGPTGLPELDDEGRFIIEQRKERPAKVIAAVLSWMTDYDFEMAKIIDVSVSYLKATEEKDIPQDLATCLIAKFYFDQLQERLPAA